VPHACGHKAAAVPSIRLALSIQLDSALHIIRHLHHDPPHATVCTVAFITLTQHPSPLGSQPEADMIIALDQPPWSLMAAYIRVGRTCVSLASTTLCPTRAAGIVSSRIATCYHCIINFFGVGVTNILLRSKCGSNGKPFQHRCGGI
jgi:hypothetical protein